MFLHRNSSLAGSVMTNFIPFHVLGVDNVLRRYNPTILPGNTNVDSGGNVWPEHPDRPGYNHVIRVATGAHEFIPAGMPHPDSALSQRTPVPNQPNPTPQTPWVPPVQTGSPEPAPASAPAPVSQGSQYDPTTGTLIPMVTPNAPTNQPQESNGGSSVLLWLGIAAAILSGG